MNILIVIANYHPVLNPNVFRWSAIAEYWVKEGNAVSVLTTLHEDEAKQDIINGVNVYRTGYASLKDYYNIKFKKRSDRNVLQDEETDLSKTTNGFLEKIVDLSWRKFYWPDGSKLFIKPGIELGTSIVEKHEINYIISVGLPFSCHLIAKEIKQQNKDLIWNMDIQDPFCYSKEFWVNNFFLYQKKNIREEKNCFKLADAISLTNQKALDKYLELFPDVRDKAKIIPPLLKQANKEVSFIFSKSITHFGYFGSFYNNVRSPRILLEYIRFVKENKKRWIEDKRFHFFGQQNRFSIEVFKEFEDVKDYVFIHGLVDPQSAQGLMSKVDFLINFGNRTDYHLPSKCVDYLGAEKPIINFKAIADDSFQEFTNKIGHILNINGDQKIDLIFEMINNFCEMKHKIDHIDLSPYHTERIAEAYENNLRN